LGEQQDDRAHSGTSAGSSDDWRWQSGAPDQYQNGDEIQDLADEFNKMTDALQNSYATLEQKVEQRTKEISALLRSHDCGEPVLGSRGHLERSHRKDYGDVSL